jgi:penicillin V acylase-like amidase (Ntn superfamily)
VIAALAGAMAFVPPAQACTSFLLRTSDGGVVYGRTMEFGFHLTSEAIVLPRQFAFTATGGSLRGQHDLKFHGSVVMRAMRPEAHLG